MRYWKSAPGSAISLPGSCRGVCCYIAAETDPLYLHALRKPLSAYSERGGATDRSRGFRDLAGLDNCFDTVLCLNVLERLEDPGVGS